MNTLQTYHPSTTRMISERLEVTTRRRNYEKLVDPTLRRPTTTSEIETIITIAKHMENNHQHTNPPSHITHTPRQSESRELIRGQINAQFCY